MRLAQNIASLRKAQDREFFNTIGFKASDPFYVFEDSHKAKMNSIKGGAKEVSEKLNQQYLNAHSERYQRIKQQAQERAERSKEMQDDDNEALKKAMEKRKQLRSIQLANQKAKRDCRNELQRKLNTSVDFGEHNVLSYCYTSKENKAQTLRKKNDNILELIKDQFKSRDEYYSPIQAKFDEDRLEQNRRAADLQDAKVKSLKERELEVKKFQDCQVKAKMEARRTKEL